MSALSFLSFGVTPNSIFRLLHSALLTMRKEPFPGQSKVLEASSHNEHWTFESLAVSESVTDKYLWTFEMTLLPSSVGSTNAVAVDLVDTAQHRKRSEPPTAPPLWAPQKSQRYSNSSIYIESKIFRLILESPSKVLFLHYEHLITVFVCVV